MRSICTALALSLPVLAGCSADSGPPADEAIRDFIQKTDNDMPSVLFAKLTSQMGQSMFDNPTRELMSEAGLSMSDFERMAAEEYADYTDEIDDYVIGKIAAGLQPGDAAVISSWANDDGKVAYFNCLLKEFELEDAAAAACEEQTGAALSDSETAINERYGELLVGAISDETGMAYFGGTTCRFLEGFARKISTKKRSISFNDLKLSLGNAKDKECDAMRDRLMDIRVDANPGQLIMR